LLYRRLAVELCQQTGNCVATQIHEGLRLREFCSRARNFTAAYERTALAPADHDSFVMGQLVNQHEPEIVSRLRVLISRVSKANYQHFQLPIADCRLRGHLSNFQLALEIGNRQCGYSPSAPSSSF